MKRILGIPLLPALVALLAISVTLGARPALREAAFVVRHAQLAARVVAKDLCYGRFLQGRTVADVRGAELGPYLDPRLSWVRATVDPELRAVRTRFLGVFRARATQRPDGSCVVGDPSPGDRAVVAPDDPALAGMRDSARPPWPEGDGLAPDVAGVVSDTAALRAAVEPEFEPTAAGTDRGTRSVLVVHRGRLVYERHAEGWDRHVPQNGRSMTKVVPALIAGIAEGRNALSLADDALRPEWTDARADISIEHLLTMRSGLAWQEANGPGDAAEATLMATNAAAYAATKPLEAQPGDRFQYSAGDAELALAIARERAREPREAAPPAADADLEPERALFRALGMNSVVMDRDPSGAPIASTFMYASATDWARLGLFLARDGVWEGRRILPEGWVDVMRTPTEASRCNYGAMVWIRGGCTEGRPAEVFELSGFMGQGVTIVPASETIVVRTGFGPWVMGDLLERVFDALGVEAPTRMAMEVDDQAGD